MPHDAGSVPASVRKSAGSDSCEKTIVDLEELVKLLVLQGFQKLHDAIINIISLTRL